MVCEYTTAIKYFVTMQENNFFTETTLPQQKTLNDQTLFPIILSPNTNLPCLSYLTSVIRDHKPWLEPLLHENGVILLRGFPVKTASEFNDIVEAFGFDEFPYVGGATPRSNIVGRMFTANESPPDQKIPFHHEIAQVPTFPSNLFFCEVEPLKGGETPIVLSHIVYERLKDKYPEFVTRLEDKGLVYTKVLGEDDDATSPIGRGWKSIFLTKDKSVAEERLDNFHYAVTQGKKYSAIM